MAFDIDAALYPDEAEQQVKNETEAVVTARLWALCDFLKTRAVFPGTAEQPDREAERLYKNAFELVLMAVAEIAYDTLELVEPEGEKRQTRRAAQ